MCSPAPPLVLSSDEEIFLRENQDELKRLTGVCDVQKHELKDLQVSGINLLQVLTSFEC
jgi:hypothetical protein